MLFLLAFKTLKSNSKIAKEYKKLIIKIKVQNLISYLHSWLFALWCFDCQISSTPTIQWAEEVTSWQSSTPLPGIFSCVCPGMTVLPSTVGETGFHMPNTNRHLPSASLSCVQASLCIASQMLNKDHNRGAAAATQLICFVLELKVLGRSVTYILSHLVFFIKVKFSVFVSVMC